MAQIINDISRTFNEYLLIPGLTAKDCTPDKISLKTPLIKYRKGEEAGISLNVPFVSAIMQAVSDDGMAIALARNGGISFIFGSQSIEDQAEMVRKVKKYKAGLVISDANLTPEHTLADVIKLKEKTGFSIKEYYNQLKISEAKKMLREKNMNLTQISIALLYNSPQYFSRAFKKVTGMTPLEYSRTFVN